MNNYYNDFLKYDLDTVTKNRTNLQIDTEKCNSIIVQNISIYGQIFVNGILTEPGQYVYFKGNENEVMYQKIILNWYPFSANISLAVVVIRKKITNERTKL